MATADDLEIAISGTKGGLGIRIVGGKKEGLTQQSNFGIFVKEVIPGSLAERDGRLEKGDQLLKANGTSLVGVSNERAVEILKNCAKTNKITFIVSRSDKSKSDFRRLSNVPLQDQLSGHPVATSTPRAPGAEGQKDHHNTSMESAERENNTRPSSASSDLTQISTTDISSHGDRDDDHDIIPRDLSPQSQKYLSTAVSSGSGHSRELTAKLSDVELSLEGPGNVSISRSNSDPPPPLPSSPPPNFDDTDVRLVSPKRRLPTPSEKAMAMAGSAVAEAVLSRSRSPAQGIVMSSPQSVELPPSPTRTAPAIHTIEIPKTLGLGIVIAGGVNRSDGPHVFVEKIMAGMDAAKDGRLKKKDRLLTVNGESFVNITREKALTTLTQLKIKPGMKTYTIVIERSKEQEREKASPVPSLPQPQRSTVASIFDSDTMVVSDRPKRTIESPVVETSAKVSDLKHTPKHKVGWPGDEEKGGGGGGRKSTTPHRYRSKKDNDDRADSMHKRLSMDPNARVKLAKLEWALSYMGYDITPQQKQNIRLTLNIDGEGRVVFLEFVKLAKEMFAFRLDDAQLETSLVYALTRKDSLELPIFPKKATSFDQLWREHSAYLSELKETTSHPVLPRAPSSELETTKKDEELEHMRQQLHALGEQRDKEREAAASAEKRKDKERQAAANAEKVKTEKQNKRMKAQIEKLKQQLKQKEEELNNTSTGSNKEVQVYRRRAEMAEAAAKSSRDKSNHLEDSLRQLEAELSILREEQPDLTNEELRRRLAAVDCQLRKEEKTVRRYQVATERLLQFVENCHEALVKTPEADRILYHPHGKGESVLRGNAVTGNPRPPSYLSRHAKVTATTLAQEAQETLTAVRKVLLVETLPFGWEEAYTEDGRKYFINHETQITSWVHPTTNVNEAQRGGSRTSTPLSRSQASSHASLHTGLPRPNQQA